MRKNLITLILALLLLACPTLSVKLLDIFKGYNSLTKPSSKNPIDTIGDLIDMGQFQKGLIDILSKMGEETENTAQAVVNIPNQVIKQIGDLTNIEMYYALEKMETKLDEKMAATYFENQFLCYRQAVYLIKQKFGMTEAS